MRNDFQPPNQPAKCSMLCSARAMPREWRPHALVGGVANPEGGCGRGRLEYPLAADLLNGGALPSPAEEPERGGDMAASRSCGSITRPDRGVGNYFGSSGLGTVGRDGASSVFEESVAADFPSFFVSSFFSGKSWARSLTNASTVQLET